MSQYFEIHPDNPQKRLIKQAVDIINNGGLIVYPTDSSYALGCLIGDKNAMERLRRIRQMDDKHNLTLVCRDLSEISTYAKINNSDYRLLKSLTPGPYTFILPGTSKRFVEPEIIPPRHCDQIAVPQVGEFVADDLGCSFLLVQRGAPGVDQQQGFAKEDRTGVLHCTKFEVRHRH